MEVERPVRLRVAQVGLNYRTGSGSDLAGAIDSNWRLVLLSLSPC
jgi:hypothetical protein